MDLFDYAFQDLLLNTALYALFAAPAFFLCWRLLAKRWHRRRIQQERRSSAAVIRKELLHSCSTLLIFAVIDTGLYFATQNGDTRIYVDLADYGSLYFVFSIVFVVVAHDAWFYWMHRAMHHPRIFRHVHRVHHISIDPSPFASYSFHPLEAIVEAGIYVVVAFAIPIHFVAILVWQLVQLAMNVIGHLGYEFFPSGANRHWLLRHLAPSTHHNLHHSRFNGNFGLYFTWWDRWMGTEFIEYHDVFEGVQRRIATSIQGESHHAESQP